MDSTKQLDNATSRISKCKDVLDISVRDLEWAFRLIKLENPNMNLFTVDYSKSIEEVQKFIHDSNTKKVSLKFFAKRFIDHELEDVKVSKLEALALIYKERGTRLLS